MVQNKVRTPGLSIADQRALCVEYAVSIRESQVDYETPIFVEEILEDAEKMLQYIRYGKKVKSMEVAPSKGLKE